MGYIYFHSRGCGKKFESPDELEVGGLCERCKRPFTEIHPYRCKVCGGEFRSDVFYPDGSLIVCPIHHGPVIVGKTSYLNWLITFLSALFAIGLAVVLIIFLVWIGSQLINLVLALLAEIVGAIAAVQHQLTSAFNALRDAAPLAVGFAVDVLKSLAKALLYLVAILLFVLVLMIRPTRDFDEIYSHSIRRNPEDLLRRQYGIAASQPSEVVLRETVKRSRKAVLSQRRIIGGLFIGISLLALKCFLPVNNLEDARQVARSTLQLGTMNVIMFTVTFYGGRRYFELDKKVVREHKHLRGVALAALFGVATVLTMIILPFWLKASLSGSAIAIELTINVVVDVCILAYEKIVDLLWKPPKDLVNDLIIYLRNKVHGLRKKFLLWWQKIEFSINRAWERLLARLHWRG